jgi:hypothetical protein
MRVLAGSEAVKENNGGSALSLNMVVGDIEEAYDCLPSRLKADLLLQDGIPIEC